MGWGGEGVAKCEGSRRGPEGWGADRSVGAEEVEEPEAQGSQGQGQA